MNGCVVEETGCHRAEGPEGWTGPEEKPVISSCANSLSRLWKYQTGQTTGSEHFHLIHYVQDCAQDGCLALTLPGQKDFVMCRMFLERDWKMLILYVWFYRVVLSTWLNSSYLHFVFLCCYFFRILLSHHVPFDVVWFFSQLIVLTYLLIFLRCCKLVAKGTQLKQNSLSGNVTSTIYWLDRKCFINEKYKSEQTSTSSTIKITVCADQTLKRLVVFFRESHLFQLAQRNVWDVATFKDKSNKSHNKLWSASMHPWTLRETAPRYCYKGIYWLFGLRGGVNFCSSVKCVSASILTGHSTSLQSAAWRPLHHCSPRCCHSKHQCPSNL